MVVVGVVFGVVVVVVAVGVVVVAVVIVGAVGICSWPLFWQYGRRWLIRMTARTRAEREMDPDDPATAWLGQRALVRLSPSCHVAMLSPATA